MKSENEIAEELYNWLSKQKYGDESLLHSSVCCDYAGRRRFIDALAREIKIELSKEPNENT